MSADKELSEILKSIDELAIRGKITRSRAFAAWFAINFFNLDEDDALEAAAADGGNDQGIDIAFADDNSQEIIVLQAHCPENLNKKTPKEKWDAVISSLPFINNSPLLAKSGRPDLAETIEGIRTSHPDYTIHLGLISLGLKSDAIERSRQAHAADKAHANTDFFTTHRKT